MSGSDAEYFPSEDAPYSSPHIHRPLSTAEVQGLDINAAQSKFVQLPISPAIVQGAYGKVTLPEHPFDKTLQHYGYVGVIDTAYQTSQNAVHPYHDGYEFRSQAVWRVIGTGLLGDIPLPLLQALLDGTLDAKVKSTDPRYNDLRDHFTDESSYWNVRQQGDFAPIHYVRMFTDRKGNPPTHRQLCLVLRDLKRYASGDPRHAQTCADIDSMTRKINTDADDIRKGGHHFFKSSLGRVRLLHMFTAAHEAYLATIPPEDHGKPIPDPLRYVGFTINIGQRTSAHTYGDSSWLMTLFGAACSRLFKRSDGTPVFRFETFVVAFPINREECRLGEELLCRLCKSYCYNGLGFNIQHGGMSNVAPKLEPYSEEAARAKWNGRLLLRTESPVFKDQVVKEFEHFLPRWDLYLKCHRRGPEEYGQDLIDKADSEITRLERTYRSEGDVFTRIELIKTQNREEEAGVEDESARTALTTIHRRVEKRLMDELDAVHETFGR
jgi:hypothetical protein